MKSWIFEKINKVDKPLAKLTKRKIRPINKIILQQGDIRTDSEKNSKTHKDIF